MALKLNHRRIGCRNSKWTVYLDDVSDEDGRNIPDFLVLAPNLQRDHLLTGAATIPVINGQVALLFNDRHPVGAGCWEIVKGFIDEGESADQASLRELEEETGYRCAPSDLIPLGTFLPEAAAMAARGALFLARNCVSGGQRDADELGLGRLTLFDIDVVRTMVMDATIEDAATAIALLRALPHLEALGRP